MTTPMSIDSRCVGFDLLILMEVEEKSRKPGQNVADGLWSRENKSSMGKGPQAVVRRI